MNAFIPFLPSQLHQGVSDVPVSCVVVDDLRSLLGALVPAGAEQRLQLQEVDVFEDVGGGLLPGPRFWSLPCRGADYRRRSAHDEVTRKPLEGEEEDNRNREDPIGDNVTSSTGFYITRHWCSQFNHLPTGAILYKFAHMLKICIFG